MTESFQIYISSASSDYQIGTAHYFKLPDIEVPSDCHIYVSINNASFPISFYNVNHYNNVLKYTFEGDPETYTVTIPRQNYSAVSLRTALNTLMTNFSVTYNLNTNKYTFTHSTNHFTFTDQSTCFDLLGFNVGETNSSISSIDRSLTSIDCVDLAPVKAFCICTNLTTGNINKIHPRRQNILCHIPVSAAPTQIQTYDNITNFRTNTYSNNFNELMIKVMTQECTEINFNGVNWTMTLQFDIVDFVE